MGSNIAKKSMYWEWSSDLQVSGIADCQSRLAFAIAVDFAMREFKPA